MAQNRREDLRLRLGLRGDRLPRLPWEVLNAGGRPLATGTDVIFSRYQSAFAPMATVLQSQPLPTLEKNQPLKILMVLAAPTDQEVLALRQEANHLNEELQQEQATRSGNASLCPRSNSPFLTSLEGSNSPKRWSKAAIKFCTMQGTAIWAGRAATYIWSAIRRG